MSDSFADLWNSTAPTKPAEPPRTLGAISPVGSGQQRKPQNDVFSLLAAASSSSSSRSVTPSYVATQQAQKSTTSKPATQPLKKTASGASDAFSDLFSGHSSNGNGTNMTIAERAALVEKQRLERLQQDRQQGKPTDHTSHVWSGLDALGASSSISPATSKPPSIKPQQEDDWGLTLDDPVKPLYTAPAIVTTSPPADDDWGLEDFVTKPAPTKAPSSQPQQRSLWDDLDDFASQPVQSSARASPAPGKSQSSTPGSFDFGDREDGFLDDQSDNDDDILGVLAKPAQPRPSSLVRQYSVSDNL